MPTIKYIDVAGDTHEIEVAEGVSVMRGAKDVGIDGIDADCGGVGACATCHVYIDSAWITRLGLPNPDEAEMLDCVTERTPDSRLSCQITVRAELDGLVVRVPSTQR